MELKHTPMGGQVETAARAAEEKLTPTEALAAAELRTTDDLAAGLNMLDAAFAEAAL